MLNFKKGKLIAFIINNGTETIKEKIFFEFPGSSFEERKRISGRKKTKKEKEEEEEVRKGSDGWTEEEILLSEEEKEEEEVIREPSGKRLKLDQFIEFECNEDEHIEPFYEPKERITMFIAGTQGCGKSYFVSQFLKDYKMAHPSRPIYLITGLEEKDAHFKGFNIRKITMDADIIKGLSLERLRYSDKKMTKKTGCLLIFDDTDRIRESRLKRHVYGLMQDALCNGRDHDTQKAYSDIDVVVTNHEINDYLNTKYILTESNYVVIFPYFTTADQIERVLKKVTTNKDTINRIIGYKGRAVIIHKVAPVYCITHNEIFLLR